MKLIMENWRKFLAEQNIRDSFYYTNYEKEPLTDEELKLIMNPEPEDDEAAIARNDLIQHMEDFGAMPGFITFSASEGSIKTAPRSGLTTMP